MVDPERELVVVMLTNRQHPDMPYPSVFTAWQSVLGKVVDAIRT
jgi:CubicO group peptidase (beta-lactamase class C family)